MTLTLALSLQGEGIFEADCWRSAHGSTGRSTLRVSDSMSSPWAESVVKIGDFGLAVAVDRSRLTREGMMVGTVY